MNSRTIGTRLPLLAVGALCLALALSMSAQVQTTTKTSAESATVVTQVERGEIAYINGNHVIVKMADGSLRDFPNVPDTARVTVDGKKLSVHDLQVGMKVQKTITTTTIPKTITTVKSVTGKVWHVTPPHSVILTLEDGTNQQFQIPKNQKFKIDGKMVDAWGLKKGMKIQGTKVVEVPEIEVRQRTEATGTMPPPPNPPPADEPILVAMGAPAPAPVEVAEALPKTASPLFLIGFLGMLTLASTFGLKALRNKLVN